MRSFLRFCFCITAISLVAGCSTAPSATDTVHYFFTPEHESKEDAQTRKDCMADNSSFNQRQLVLSAAAIQNAWVYCFRQADIWYPGEKDDPPELDHGW
ncbi:MAG: hypothetical protein O7F73_12480 [Gammaproteobacteria bacterium]|nr:hypothetical protein [Gammaproteobacteria bacterium]